MKIDYVNGKFSFVGVVECPRIVWNFIRPQLYRNVFYCLNCRHPMSYYPQLTTTLTNRAIKAHNDVPAALSYNQINCNDCGVSLSRALVPGHGYIYGCSAADHLTNLETWIKTHITDDPTMTVFIETEDMVEEVE